MSVNIPVPAQRTFSKLFFISRSIELWVNCKSCIKGNAKTLFCTKFLKPYGPVFVLVKMVTLRPCLWDCDSMHDIVTLISYTSRTDIWHRHFIRLHIASNNRWASSAISSAIYSVSFGFNNVEERNSGNVLACLKDRKINYEIKWQKVRQAIHMSTKNVICVYGKKFL